MEQPVMDSSLVNEILQGKQTMEKKVYWIDRKKNG